MPITDLKFHYENSLDDKIEIEEDSLSATISGNYFERGRDSIARFQIDISTANGRTVPVNLSNVKIIEPPLTPFEFLALYNGSSTSAVVTIARGKCLRQIT